MIYIAIMHRKMWRHRITSAGQVSIPAEVRDRWGARMVSIVDEGDHLVVRPTVEDPVAALQGIFAGKGVDIPADEALRIADEAERRAEERKWGHASSSTRSR
jgi:AbrB family looped-hinge helix DNA binding protein